MGGKVELKFERCYKLQVTVQQTTLRNLRTELLRTQIFMNRELFNILKVNLFFEKLLEALRELWNNMMSAPEVAMDIGVVIAKEVT